MKLKASSLAATFLLGLIPAVCRAQDFSADVVYLAISKPGTPSTGTGTSPHPSPKLYVSKEKMRLETHGLADTILLVNGGEHTALMLRLARFKIVVSTLGIIVDQSMIMRFLGVTAGTFFLVFVSKRRFSFVNLISSSSTTTFSCASWL